MSKNSNNRHNKSINTGTYLDINYEKLADAIAKAIVKEPKKNKMDLRSRLMRFINGVFYITISIGCVWAILQIWEIKYPTGRYDLVTAVILSVLLGLGMIMMFIAQQESLDDTSTNTEKYFTLNVQLITLIVAIVALIR